MNITDHTKLITANDNPGSCKQLVYLIVYCIYTLENSMYVIEATLILEYNSNPSLKSTLKTIKKIYNSSILSVFSLQKKMLRLCVYVYDGREIYEALFQIGSARGMEIIMNWI